MFSVGFIVKMTEDKVTMKELKLDPDCELRFEVEAKNEKVTLEVSLFVCCLLS